MTCRYYIILYKELESVQTLVPTGILGTCSLWIPRVNRGFALERKTRVGIMRRRSFLPSELSKLRRIPYDVSKLSVTGYIYIVTITPFQEFLLQVVVGVGSSPEFLIAYFFFLILDFLLLFIRLYPCN